MLVSPLRNQRFPPPLLSIASVVHAVQAGENDVGLAVLELTVLRCVMDELVGCLVPLSSVVGLPTLVTSDATLTPWFPRQELRRLAWLALPPINPKALVQAPLATSAATRPIPIQCPGRKALSADMPSPLKLSQSDPVQMGAVHTPSPFRRRRSLAGATGRPDPCCWSSGAEAESDAIVAASPPVTRIG